MDSNAYPPLANASIPVQSRVLGPSCCPDKDLVLLISRLGGLDRISLWNSNSGAKVWETSVSDDDTTVHVDGVAWSPDGQSIACMLDPPRVTLHSIQDGRIITSLPLELPLNHVNLHLSDIWWFPARAKATKHAVIPDIFRRNNIITGSSESTLKFLPYLDRLQEESDRLTATNLFAFQGSQTRTHGISQLPEAISAWPTLSPDSKIMAVDSTIQHQSSIKTEEPPEEKDDSNLNSILMVSDTLGNVYSFLDGTFPLGVVCLGREASFLTAEKSNHGSKFFGHAKFNSVAPSRTSISPTVIDMTLLANRKTRDLARLSSIVRDLTWYIMRVVKEMKEVWFGNESSTGARELGPRWVDAFRAKQKEQFGQSFADPILDLTWLLTTGRASEALTDFLGSSEQMTERAIQKWDSTMADGLAKLRDYSEKRLTPAFQRVHLVLEELQGWSYEQSRQYSVFQLDGQQLREAIEASARGVILSSELAAISRRELFRFKEFLVWLRFEIANINPTSEPHPCRHDILEVNNYFVSGLTFSAIDSWFQGEVPQFKPHHLGVPQPGDGPLNGVLDRARQAAADPSYLEWQANIVRNDHSSLPRNLVALTEDLAVRCRGIFGRAAGAASRSARVHHHEPPISVTEPNNQSAFIFRERIVQESDVFLDNFLTIVKDHNVLVLVKSRYGDNGSDLSLRVGIVNIQCNVNTPSPTILAAEHFDDETIAVVYRVKRDAFLSTMVHSYLEYLDVPFETGVAANLEDLVQSAINEWKAGNIASNRVVLTRRRILSGCKHGEAELTVNGRRNRRVACVVDNAGSRFESFDLGEDAEDTEDEE